MFTDQLVGPGTYKWWGFIAIGMLLGEYKQIGAFISKHYKAFFVGAVAVAAIGLIEPYLNNTLGYLFNKVAIFPLATGVTLALAIYYSSEKAIGRDFLNYVGSRTFGIYLGHFFFVDILRNQIIPGDRALVAVIVLGICLAAKAIKDRVTIHLPWNKDARVSA